MPVLEDARRVYFVPDAVEFAQQLVGIVGDCLVVVPDGEAGVAQDLYYQHTVVCRKRAAALGDDVGVGEPVLHADIYELRDGVVDIFLNGVVHRVLARRRAGAVVVHPESSAHVDELHLEVHLAQLHIELHGLAQGGLDAAYFRYLAADVEVYELEARGHLVLAQELQGVEQFRAVEAELRDVAARLFPFAGAGGA